MIFGTHINDLKKYLPILIKLAENNSLNVGAIQIFVSGPNDTSSALTANDIKEVKKFTKAGGKVFVHASHLDHILGKKYGFTIINIRSELDTCANIGASGFIIHLPKYPADRAEWPAKTSDIIGVLKKLLSPDFISKFTNNNPLPTIYFEVQPNPAHADFVFLSSVILKISKEFPIPIGLALDTAHLWSAGLKVNDADETAKHLAVIDELLPAVPKVLHLNDQKYDFNSGSDEHRGIGKGQIWYKSRESLKTWLKWADRTQTPVILERDKESIPGDIEIMGDLMKKL